MAKLDELISHLHPLEIQTLRAFTNAPKQFASEVLALTKLSEDRLRMALEWLQKKEFITVVGEKKETLVSLTEASQELKDKRLIELRIIERLSEHESMVIPELAKHISEENKETNIAVANLKKANIVEIQKGGVVRKIENADISEFTLRQQLIDHIAKAGVCRKEDFDANTWNIIESGSRKRGKSKGFFRITEKIDKQFTLTESGQELLIMILEWRLTGEEISQLTPQMLKDGSWKTGSFRAYNIGGSFPRIVFGKQNEVEVDCALFEQYLGKSYMLEEIITGLKNYGLTVQEGQVDTTSKVGPTSIVVSTYPYRLDYMHAVDVVEDFAISIGYNTFEPTMPERFTVGHLSPMTLLEDRVREALIGFGFEEVILNILTNKEDFGEKVHNMYSDLLEVSNPMTETYSSLRNSLIPSLLKVESKSFKSMYPHKVFEVGEVVIRDDKENHGCATNSQLAALLSHAEANFSEMGSYLTHLQYLMFWDVKIQTKHFPIFIEGRSGEIMADDIPVGMIGGIHPEILDKWGIKMPTVLFELDLSVLFSCSA